MDMSWEFAEWSNAGGRIGLLALPVLGETHFRHPPDKLNPVRCAELLVYAAAVDFDRPDRAVQKVGYLAVIHVFHHQGQDP